MMNNVSGRTNRLALIGLLSAIIVVQSFTVLGYIPIPPLSPTAIHVTVAIGAVVLGPSAGAQLGLVWGLVVFIRAFVYPTSAIAPLVFTNPMISVFPRVMIGVVAGWLFLGLRRLGLRTVPAAAAAGVAGALTNTVLVLGMIYVFKWEVYAGALGADVTKPLTALLAIAGTNSIAEMVIAGVLTPAVTRPLFLLRGRMHRPAANHA